MYSSYVERRTGEDSRFVCVLLFAIHLLMCLNTFQEPM